MTVILNFQTVYQITSHYATELYAVSNTTQNPDKVYDKYERLTLV